MTFVINLVVSATVISFAAWLSGRFPAAAGFFVAMPLATMIVLPLSHAQHGQTQNTLLLAKSILIAVPISLSFFIPFLVSSRFGLSFWQAYVLGCVALPVGYLIHRGVTRLWF
jgi:hypothetical protein